MFILAFDENGLLSLAPPESKDPAELAESYAALGRWSAAIYDFHERLIRIEEAYQGFLEATRD